MLLTSSIASLKAKSEVASLGSPQKNEEVGVSFKYRQGQTAVGIIRPRRVGDRFRLIFIFGDKKWCRNRSIFANAVLVTYN